MEIEAKFIVPDQATFDRLLQVEALSGSALSLARLKRLHDRYLDTASGGFLRGGFACRVRMDDQGGRLITLKSLTPAPGLLHERQELEVSLPACVGLDPTTWPACDATALASQLSQGQPLTPLFELRQERYQRLGTPVGAPTPAVELSIDRVRFDAAAQDDLMGVEVELLSDSDRTALEAIVEELQQGWGLIPEPISKFERGLAQVRPELFPLLRAR
jgi:inorganic triphosphatase YgiF